MNRRIEDRRLWWSTP